MSWNEFLCTKTKTCSKSSIKWLDSDKNNQPHESEDRDNRVSGKDTLIGFLVWFLLRIQLRGYFSPTLHIRYTVINCIVINKCLSISLIACSLQFISGPESTIHARLASWFKDLWSIETISGNYFSGFCFLIQSVFHCNEFWLMEVMVIGFSLVATNLSCPEKPYFVIHFMLCKAKFRFGLLKQWQILFYRAFFGMAMITIA